MRVLPLAFAALLFVAGCRPDARHQDVRRASAESSVAEALPDSATVRRAIDGDTVELTDGRLVRYIGIDTPEVRRRRGGAWVLDPEPFGEAAREANAAWVQGKRVRLEYDVERRDRHGRLLAYVYVDGDMVNARLVREGYAKPLTIPPNVAHAEAFRRLSAEARRMRRGLWADAPDR